MFITTRIRTVVLPKQVNSWKMMKARICLSLSQVMEYIQVLVVYPRLGEMTMVILLFHLDTRRFMISEKNQLTIRTILLNGMMKIKHGLKDSKVIGRIIELYKETRSFYVE